MTKDYQFIEFMDDKLIVLDVLKYGTQIWSLCKIRTDKKCIITGESLKGKLGYRPISNQSNRMDRLSNTAILEIILPTK